MSHGFLALNDSSQVLVSSDTRNLHFIGKPPINQVRNVIDSHGGCRIFSYIIDSQVPVVPFFTMPTGDYHGITAIRNITGSTWEIEVLRSGVAAVHPDVYVFADPRATNPNGTHGMQVFRDDGTPSFDSRLRPLAIAGGISVTQPYNPKPVLPFGLDPKNCGTDAYSAGIAFAPDQYNAFNAAITPSKPMYSYSSIAQAQRDAMYTAFERNCPWGSYKGNCLGPESEYTWTSTYWTFYRGGVRRSGSQIHAGWIAVSYGCNWTYKKDSSFLGIGTGGDSGYGGAWPYSNETLNLQPTPVIIADASRYD